MVTIRQGGVRDAQELLLEAFQTGSFYGPLSWNKLFDVRLFKEKAFITMRRCFSVTMPACCTVYLRVSAATA